MTRPLTRRLGRTDLEVFPLNLGGNAFGWTADREATFAVLDAYREAGGNFLDTADVYSNWVPGHAGGESERLIGAWLSSRGCRDEFIVATKVGMGGPDLGKGLSPDQVKRGCEASLGRLGIERIDLFYAHQDDAATPLEQSLRALDALVREGKARVIGASNYTAPRLAEALDVSARHDLASYGVLQTRYNLVVRGEYEGALSELCLARGLGVCTFPALASGFLTGKYRAGEKATGARAGGAQRYLDDPAAMARLERVRAVASKHGATPAQVALAWQLHQPFVTAPIASATNASQVRELASSVELRLDARDMATLDA
jgi:aryl-alcohol dehydrogenase-like predicted oxidoreductase